MVHRSSYLAFMLSSVHISIKNKIYISRFRHPDNPDVMLADIISFVIVFAVTETEYSGHFVGIYIVRPQISLLDKSHYRSFAVRHKLYICICDPQIYFAIAYKVLLRCDHLFYLTLEVQKVYSCLVIAHTVEFVYLIFLCFSFLILR